MIDNYNIRFYKNGSRVAPRALNDIDARLFYRQMKLLMGVYESAYGERLSEESILISVNGVEMYRTKDRLLKIGIETVEDLLEYIDIDFEPSYIFINNMLGNKKIKLLDVYVIRIIR